MRDRNLTQTKFNIQLSKSCNSLLPRLESLEEYFSHKSCLRRSDTENLYSNSVFKVRIPKEYRLLRALSISLWYFPENLHWLYFLELKERTFPWLNRKQRIEISILLDSKETMEKYLFLTERYTSGEIFGNILGNDLRDLQKILNLQLIRQRKAKKKVFRRGPTDKGTRRSDSSDRIIEEEIKKDKFLQEEYENYLKKEYLLQQTSHRIQKYLRTISEKNFP